MKNLTIKSKILFISLCSLIILGVVLAIISVTQSRSILEENAYKRLETITLIKQHQLETFFQEVTEDITILSRNLSIHTLVEALIEIHPELNLKEKDDFPINNQLVKDTISKYEDSLLSFSKESGYKDILIIGSDSGRVVYSTKDNSDYGANLIYGKLKDSALARVWKKAIELKRPVFEDMSLYLPTGNNPEMFIGTPIYIKDRIEAILVFRFDEVSINEIITFRKGFGESEETLLLGPDSLLRSDSILLPKVYNLKKALENPETNKITTSYVKDGLSGGSGFGEIKAFSGDIIMKYYAPIKVGQDFKWVIISKIDKKEVLITPNRIRNIIIIASLLLIAIVGISMYIFVNSMVVKPLNVFQNGLLSFFKYLNKETEDTQELIVDRKDEIGLMSSIVNENINKIKKGLEEEKKLIDNASEIINTVNTGVLTDRILL
ncbi:cache domain-containing protein, partial [Malaciobacter mytili]|uniref:cache domain-containing protein n=1 Tax=Malaciobacter mytili TaxID=603050 RepID=UPI003A86366E